MKQEAYLIFIQFAVFEGGLPLGLEGDDDETDEDVDHEEGDDDDVDEVKDSYSRPKKFNLTL